jgi:hypothetical protein
MGKKRTRGRELLFGEAGIASSSAGVDRPPKNLKKQKLFSKRSKKVIYHSPTSRAGVIKQARTSKTDGSDSPDAGTEPSAPPAAVNMSIIRRVSATSYIEDRSTLEFPYRRLNAGFLEIRVLTLLPGSRSASIVCHIDNLRADHISNDSEENYNALSYTWGSPDATRVLHLQGVVIKVRENLWQVDQVFSL